MLKALLACSSIMGFHRGSPLHQVPSLMQPNDVGLNGIKPESAERLA